MNLTGSHAAVGEVVAGDDLVLVHLREHPGLPQVWDQDVRPHSQGDAVAVVINQFPQFLFAHFLQVSTLGHTLPGHPKRVCGGALERVTVVRFCCCCNGHSWSR